ncbi:MAG: hypothetical protein M4579_005381 [Chaenotheca gracillima]|nr:MAG: hypothetical protein M4579_005381 [Chaenotheca gracillima]
MNCPSRTDDIAGHDGWNQSPPALAADTTTRQDMSGVANLRSRRDHQIDPGELEKENSVDANANITPQSHAPAAPTNDISGQRGFSAAGRSSVELEHIRQGKSKPSMLPTRPDGPLSPTARAAHTVWNGFKKFAKFVGPGFMVSVAYIDPGNYSTDTSAGATYRFQLLFVILMSNLFAIFLQSLCVKLGTVTGLNLAENCRLHLPKWLNILLYLFAEGAIIATDIAEVIGSAIALNLLLHVPLVAGCAITLVDVLVILIFYDPSGSMRRLRAFEGFIIVLVLGVVICFCVELSYIRGYTVGEVMKGYIPSPAVVETKGLYLSCGILGATVMPHSLYLGSGLVQSRLRSYDEDLGDSHADAESPDDGDDAPKYRPSLAAIHYCLRHSVIELTVCLFTFALFVNSSILIVAGASLSKIPNAADADLFDVHDLLSRTLAPVAGTVFALALFLSGTSAGIVCTMAGQMVSEGALNWTVKPWLRRLLTRSISITPSIIIAAAVGRDGLSAALNGTQVALSVILPFVSAPLIYFTCRNKYMSVSTSDRGQESFVKMRNNWITATFAVLIWLVIVIMNVALLVLEGKGKA